MKQIWQQYEERIGKIVLLSLIVMIIGMIMWGFYDAINGVIEPKIEP
jgi:hypothetical protein